MRTHILVVGSLLGILAIASVADAGRGGDDRRGGGGGAPAGSGSFRAAPEPRAEPSRAAAPEARAPRVQPQEYRAPSLPVEQHYQAPPKETRQQYRAPAPSGSANVLPSVSTQFRAPAANPSGNPFRQPRAPQAAQPTARAQEPAARAQERDDFLDMHEEPARKPAVVPNHFFPQTAPGVNNRTTAAAAVPAPRSFEQTARRSILPEPPGRPARPPRPALPDRWNAVNNNYSAAASRWSHANSANLATFQAARATHWNQVRQYQKAAAWRGRYGTPEYRQWRRDLWDYRRARVEEIWNDTPYLYENLFNNYWWQTCWWRQRPWAVAADVPPWWWWVPATWADESSFFGPALGSAPIAYDPGDNVYYDDNTYDVDGQDAGSADDARDQADALANPQVSEIPIPEPAPDGQPEQWLPLGSWALTQQEQGDPVMYFQIRVNRAGIVAGGYKNALTGDEQPIVGQLDKKTQRLAWHIASAPQTVFETGLSSLDYDAANVFLHFNGSQTQTWLLVRLPSPQTPPGEVRVPNEGS
jgi:hypothetical protein